LNWYNTHVKGKNWRCNNFLDNLSVANLNAIHEIGARNNANQISSLNITREFQDKMVTEIGKVDISIVTSTDIILNRIWDED